MTALDTAEALAADRCSDLHGRETACLACRRAVGEELRMAWLDGQIENERYLLSRGRGSRESLAFLLEERAKTTGAGDE